MKNTYLLIALFFFAFYKTNAQVIDFKNDAYWLSYGFGMAMSNGYTDDISVVLSLNHTRENTSIKTRFLLVTEFDIFSSSNESIVNLGVLYGKISSKKFLQTSYSYGLGITTISERGDLISNGYGWLSSGEYEMKTATTLSIPLEVLIDFKPIKFVAIGLTAFADVNIKRSVYGITAILSLGKLR